VEMKYIPNLDNCPEECEWSASTSAFCLPGRGLTHTEYEDCWAPKPVCTLR